MIQLKTGNDLKAKLLTGVEKLASSVISTLGPGGRTAIISDEIGGLKITKDGVSVAKAFTELEDTFENIGAQLIKKVSEKSLDGAGDGTTTATLLAYEMIKSGFSYTEKGINMMEVKRGMDDTAKLVVEELGKLRKDIFVSSEEGGVDQLKQVATISGNNDPEIGEMISQAISKVGSDGVVYIEESKTYETSLEFVEGLMFDRGMKSPYFSTNNGKVEAVLDNPLILVTDERVTSRDQILQVMNYAATKSKPLLFIAGDIDGEALAIMLVNKANGNIKIVPVKAPGYGDRMLPLIEDIAITTGATVISSKFGTSLASLTANDFQKYLGEARSVTSTNNDTTIVDGKGEEEKIATRIMELKEQMDNVSSAHEKEILQERLSRLVGGVAIISVGGNSEVESKEKKDRVDDALHATKAAIAEGILPGGGMGLFHVYLRLKDLPKSGNHARDIGRDIILNAISKPAYTIISNAGVDENPWIILSEFARNKHDSWLGYDSKNHKYTNFLEDGILDPMKVTRLAFENAVGVAGVVLTSEVAIQEVKNKSTENQNIDY